MRYYGIKSLYYTADLWELNLDSDGRPTTERFIETRRLHIDTSEASSLNIDSEEPLREGTVLRNIKDRSGTLVYPATPRGGDLNSGESYIVFAEKPLLSPFGTREGFTSRARRLQTA